MTTTPSPSALAKPFCAEHPTGTDQPCGGCARARRALTPATPATVTAENAVIRKPRLELREEKRKRNAAQNALRKVLHHYAITPTKAAELFGTADTTERKNP